MLVVGIDQERNQNMKVIRKANMTKVIRRGSENEEDNADDEMEDEDCK